MLWLVVLWFVLFGFFVGSYGIYFAYLRKCARRPWGLKVEAESGPALSVLVPAHNEVGVIGKKLENLVNVDYPRQKLEVFVIDDASSDGTLAEVENFVKSHPDFPVKLVKQNPRRGKAAALNKALGLVSHDTVVVTDADAFWEKDILAKAVPYLSDSTVGAVSGRQVADSSKQSWVAKGETGYLDLISVLRLGESKIHSTIRFEGVFCAFKRACFDEFDSSGADDSGTALKIVENGFRAILVPEVSVPSAVPTGFKERLNVKTRRSVHLTGLWVQCLKNLLGGHRGLPKKIAVPEILISLFDPFVFFVLACVTIALIVLSPILLIPIAALLGFFALVPKTRAYLVHGVLDQFVMLYSILLYARQKRFTAWEKT
jgi:cellulose synthase/poly-beta-1,6-N-acetylglucosamine synthase-like glycosyltransferase